jgi:hypothetical protein
MCLGLLCVALPTSGQAQEEELGCGPKKEKFSVERHKGEHPTPEPSLGKAIIYVAKGSGKPGREGAYRLGVNGKWVGANTKNTYYYFESDPGLLKLCAEGAWKKGMQFLTVEPGKSYYLYLNVGVFVGTHEGIFEFSKEEWKKLTGKYQYITFQLKQ